MHEEAVAGVAQGPGIIRRRRVIEELKLALVAAVPVSEEEPVVARSYRPEDADVGGMLDETAVIARHLVEVHDVRVRGVFGVGGEADTPGQAFVRSAVFEGMAVRERLAFGDPQLQRAVHGPSESHRRVIGAGDSCVSREGTTGGIMSA